MTALPAKAKRVRRGVGHESWSEDSKRAASPSLSSKGGPPRWRRGGVLNPSFCPSAFWLPLPSSLEGRTQKEKKAARARSKGKNSDEEAPKAAQKKLKLVRT